MPSKKDKPLCRCPADLQKICKRVKLTTSNKSDIEEIVNALALEEQTKKQSKKCRVPKLRIKRPFRKPTFPTSPTMSPDMELRMRYISHCDREPFKRVFETTKKVMCTPEICDLDFSSDGQSKSVRYKDQMPLAISIPDPVAVVKHTDSDKSIVNVPSPKLSGQNIAARRASAKPTEAKPPLPPKSGHDLFKPHSGIILNQEASFVPDEVYIPDPLQPIDKMSKKKGKRKPCSKGGVCSSKNCRKKRCRQFVAWRRRQAERAAARNNKNDPCWAKSAQQGPGGKMRSKSCLRGSAPSGGARGPARDGKPRSRQSKRTLGDDDVCGLDDSQRPDYPEIPMSLKKGSLKTHSLTNLACTKEKRPDVHYGILMGTFNMYSDRFGGRSRGRQALTMSVMAYCLAFHYHPKQWTMKLIDNLLDAGDTWYLQCADRVHDHSAYQGICEVLPFGKKQVLVLNGKRMQVLLCEPDIVGYTMSKDPTVYNLCRGMKAFFMDNRAGILLSRILKVVIWKDKICYYIFDPAGRNSRAYSNYAVGTGALINVKDLESVADILLARSVLEDQKFVLAPVKVLKMVDEKSDEDFESDKELTQAEKAMMSYRILSENCAIVNANMHLGDRCFEDTRFRQALTIAVAAMTYAKISPPNTWFTKTLDKILRLGNKLYVDCTQPKVLIDLTVDNIPNEIIIGPYICEIIIYRERVKGQLFTTKECLLNIKTGLDDFFKHSYNSGILEFNNYALAVWRQKEMFYLFDPYPRTNDGERSLKTGKACCLMLLDTESTADAITKNWDYLPATTQFYIHAFKVLKLRKRQPKTQIKCTLSDNDLPGAKLRRQVLKQGLPGEGRGDGKETVTNALPVEVLTDRTQPQIDEERMGDIISLVDSIQEDFVPPIPLKYKNMPPDPIEPKVLNLDSPTVSVTQVVPPWPKPRDKTNEPPEPDPDPEPTPPPTPPPLPPPEGGVEEEEAEEEELDEEALKAKKEEEKRRKAEEEEARRKAEELPPPLPPPPPSPQPESEVPLASAHGGGRAGPDGVEIETVDPVVVERYILLTEDATKRFKLRQIRNKMTAPLTEGRLQGTPEEELKKDHNFMDLPDTTQIIRGAKCIAEGEASDVLPFAAIMAIVTSYKYAIETWTKGIVDFVIDTAEKLHKNKKERFQLSPMHIIPKIGIGHQAFHATIDVVGEGATWQLEDVLTRKFLNKYDRGIITTSHYSCAFFRRNGLYYLFDGSCCNPMGLRNTKEKNGKACFLRFRKMHDLVCRIINNKDGGMEDQQFILSRILVRRLLPEPRMKLPEDYDYATGLPKGKKSKATIIDAKDKPKDKSKDKSKDKPKMTSIETPVIDEDNKYGYRDIHGIFKINGTTALSEKEKKASSDVKSCHFVCLVAMLMAAMHPFRTWNQIMVDSCIEKGLEIYEKALNLSPCEKRVIKNVILDDKFINVNIKKIIVINENQIRTNEQYMRAVLNRLRYVIVRYPQCSLVVCQTGGFYHLFDPYPPPDEEPELAPGQLPKEKKEPKKEKKGKKETKAAGVAGWTQFRYLDNLLCRLRRTIDNKTIDEPQFYTFELTSVKTAPRHTALNYKLSPLFKPEENPNRPYLVRSRKKPRPLVDEKTYWLNIDVVPWSRMNTLNALGFDRGTPRTMWMDWDIEFPGDLYSLWGTIHPLDQRFVEKHRGKQYIACSLVAIAMSQACEFNSWTGSFLDGIVITGDKCHEQMDKKVGSKKNYELTLEDYNGSTQEMYPYSFTVKCEKIIFGFIYNINPDRFNLSKALAFFFENHNEGMLISSKKNLAFGKVGASYYLFDCQSFGAPIFGPCQGAAYVLKCESLNRLIYCMTITLNQRSHNQLFHLYKVDIKLSEKAK